ncbi:MAG: hypothetical protein SAqBPW_42830 [Shewanella algae]
MANNPIIEHKVDLAGGLINREMAPAESVFASATSKVISDAES